MHTEIKHKKHPADGNRWREIVIVLLAVLLLISLSLLVVNKYIFVNGGVVEPQLVIPEANGQVFDGMLPTDNPDEILALLQEKVDENQFAFRINANPFLPPTVKAAICVLRTLPGIFTPCRPS
jgi:hypothetical protein